MYDKYVEERLNKRSKPITDTLQRCNLPLFGTPEKRQSSKTSNQVADLKSDCQLFSRLYIAFQAREGNLEEFFKHENSSSPPALSRNEKMRTGQKSNLITCIEVNTAFERPSVDAVVLDGVAIVNMLPPGKCKTFKGLRRSSFSPVRHQLSHSECKENRFSVGSLLGEQPQARYSWSPPSQAALEQHIKRAAYQAGQVWGQTLVSIQKLPSAAEWGCHLSLDGWKPTWTTLPEASKASNELIRCGCRQACRLPCTALCACNGNCYQD